MLLNKELRKEILKMFLGILVLSLIVVALFFVAGHGSKAVVFGVALGSFVALLNYYFLALTISLASQKDPSTAKSRTALSYPIRLILMAAVVIFSIKSPHFNFAATAIPLLFPGLLIKIFALLQKKKPVAQTVEAAEADTLNETEV